MTKIRVNLLGTPSIVVDGVQQQFPFSRAEALVYYMATVKSESKQTLADMFWGDKYEDERASKNLRNAMYLIRKQLGKDFFDSKNRRNLCLNDVVNISIDMDEMKRDLSVLKDRESLTYLQHFVVKDSTLFDEFLEQKRAEVLEYLYHRVADEMHSGRRDYVLWEQILRNLMKENPYEERLYQLLMELYVQQGRPKLGVSVYEGLRKFLNKELGVEPDKSLQTMAETLKAMSGENLRNAENMEIPGHPGLFGRRGQMDSITQELDRFLEHEPCQSVMVSGDFGTGKSRLIREALQDYDKDPVCAYKFRCYRNEEQFIMILWQIVLTRILRSVPAEKLYRSKTFLEKIEGFFHIMYDANGEIANIVFNMNQVDNSNLPIYLLELIGSLLNDKRVVIFVDDLQWIDRKSLAVLHSILTIDKNQTLFFILSYDKKESARAKSFSVEMCDSHYLKEICLGPLGYYETARLAEHLFENETRGRISNQQIFEQTGGNPFYVQEVCEIIRRHGSTEGITQNIENLIIYKLSKLDEQSTELLELLSVLYDRIEYWSLAEFIHGNDAQLLKSLETLIKENFIYEEEKNGIVYLGFQQEIVNQYIYDKISLTKKQLMHTRIGQWFEEKFIRENDDNLLPKVIYHYMRSGNKEKVGEYTVKYWNKYFELSNDFFPVISDFDMNYSAETYYNNHLHITSIVKMIEEQVLHQLRSVQWRPYGAQLDKSMYMLAQYYVKQPDYEKAQFYIRKIIDHNQREPLGIEQKQNLLDAYKQEAFIYTNQYRISELESVLEQGLTLAEELDHISQATWHRLKGWLYVMTGQLEESRCELRRAIQVLKEKDRQEDWLTSIAIATNYIGETYRQEGNLEAAFGYFKDALELMRDRINISGITFLYMRMGQVYLQMEKWEKAHKYLANSVKSYGETNLIWYRSVTYYYLAKVLVRQKDMKHAEELLRKGYDFAQLVESPFEIAFCCHVLCEIADGDSCGFTQEFCQDVHRKREFYDREYKSNLEQLLSPYEKKEIQEFTIY